MSTGRWGGRTTDRAGQRDVVPVQVVRRVTENIALDVVQFRPGDVVRNVQTGEEGVVTEGSHGSRVMVQWEQGRESAANKDNLTKVIGSRENSDPAEDASPQDYVGKTVHLKMGPRHVYGKVRRARADGNLAVEVKVNGQRQTMWVSPQSVKMSSFNDEYPFSHDSDDMTTDPPVSEKQRKAMGAAMSGHSNLGIPKSVGSEYIHADPGGKLPAHK